jgi:hypothetical protein
MASFELSERLSPSQSALQRCTVCVILTQRMDVPMQAKQYRSLEGITTTRQDKRTFLSSCFLHVYVHVGTHMHHIIFDVKFHINKGVWGGRIKLLSMN